MTFQIASIVGLLAAVLVAILLRRREINYYDFPERFPLFGGLAYLLTLAATFVLALTGFYFSIVALEMIHGYPLLIHLMAGGLMIFVLPALALFRGDLFASPSQSTPRKIFFWSFLTFGLFTGVTILVSMTPAFDPAGVGLMIELHRWVSLLATMSLLGLIISK